MNIEARYRWIEAELDQLRSFQGANFVVIASGLLMVRFAEPTWFFSVTISLALLLCAYSAVCNGMVAGIFRSLRVRLAQVEAFGKIKMAPTIENRDPFSNRLRHDRKKRETNNRTPSAPFGLLLGITPLETPMDETTIADFYIQIEGPQDRAGMSMIYGIIFFGLSLFSYLLYEVW